MIFDPKSAKLYCGHCNNYVAVRADDEEVLQAALAERQAEGMEKAFADKTYVCPDCGGPLKTDERETSLICEYCGASVVIPDRLSGGERPMKMIPFKTDRASAVGAFKKWCKGGLLTPRGFVSEKNIKRMKGIYVPYWLFDADVHSRVDATATKVRTYVTGETQYTETSFFDVRRDVDMIYRSVPCDASVKLDDEMMKKLEPFDYSQMEPFCMDYLAGYESNCYDLDEEHMKPVLAERVNAYAYEHTMATISGYSTVNVVNQNTGMVSAQGQYALMPVWQLDYTYRGQPYNFVMNGQTGKVIGKPPVSPFKAALWGLSVTAVVFALLMLIALIWPGTAATVAAAASHVVDMAGLLDESEEEELEDLILQVREEQQLDLAVVTTQGTDGKYIRDYADDYYDENGYGYDESGTGIILVVDMSSRQFWISTAGRAIDFFTDTRIDAMLDDVYSEFSDGDYYDGCVVFVEDADRYMNVPPGQRVRRPPSLMGVLIRLLISAAVGAVVVAIMVKSRGGKTSVNEDTYMSPGESRINVREDRFVRRTVVTRRMPKAESGSSSGSGSSTHSSSSGSAHGGGGRSF